ncbi:hypothetical protein CNYM01_05372 [Colletotrichum nymphaeae SA-01]|uniref:Uncharacterized protein n=1 Tax=Colletotrichum nymphaeae SA-01 TaxID=1460502 RepID=A0A135TCF0_9PEZI|nr:hypothetical protein CNYM01_05372 [Colletotrichum nymphaeae SA-01]
MGIPPNCPCLESVRLPLLLLLPYSPPVKLTQPSRNEETPLALRLPGRDPSNPMRGQSPIPKVAFALPHLITPVVTAALLVPELLPTGPRQSAAAVPERHAPNQRYHRRSRTRPARSGLLGSLGHWTGERSMSPNKVPKKAGRDWVGAAALRRRRRSRPTVTADASGIFGPGAEVVGSIRAVSGPLISDIFSVPVVLPEAPATTLTL